MTGKGAIPLLLSLAAGVCVADPLVLPAATRGELLYGTHCATCHDSAVHWREKSPVTDWESLRGQVNRWQEVANLGWGLDAVGDVTRYLNELHYHYLVPE